MDRSTFLISFWKRRIKPILLILLVLFCVNFTENLFTENGIERVAAIMVIGYGLLMLLSAYTNKLFTALGKKLSFQLPASLKLWWRVLLRVLDFIFPITLGILIYHFWELDQTHTLIVVGLMLMLNLFEIIKEEVGKTSYS